MGLHGLLRPLVFCPFRLHSQSGVCIHAKERDAVKSLLEPRIQIAKEDAIPFLKSKFPSAFFFLTAI